MKQFCVLVNSAHVTSVNIDYYLLIICDLPPPLCQQKLGDSYRGFCCSEAELEAILLLHKQQTGCVFGTRQSPSVDKPATRLMWKSQYVPYDGIPFVNAGSRAIVMECQFGPRRKGLNKSCEHTYRATCPARIYIKSRNFGSSAFPRSRRGARGRSPQGMRVTVQSHLGTPAPASPRGALPDPPSTHRCWEGGGGG
ncbi:calcium-responsive transcription factor [Morone saxatilis]|uniref:calcium-responsive transcription factor n=1 Tax=Morone saxatilis TaxID=34816 RepID=UPI0015E24ABB|nr:calcium-responsive transcription factor [Morone saxatilis]